VNFSCAGLADTLKNIGIIGCPTWIRTMNNASKGRCVTITPSDKPPDIKLSSLGAQSENHQRHFVTKESLPASLFSDTM
jgi:hypothetical protein